MAVSLYTGLPGAGKSYGVVRHVIVPALEANRVLVTNLPLVADELIKRYPDNQVVALPAPDDLEGWKDIPAGAVILIDEAWRYWPSGLRTNKIEEAHREFFAMHRHSVDESGKSQQIVLVTQNPEQLASFVRGLVETHYRVVKLSALGRPNTYRVDMYESAKLSGAKAIRCTFGKYEAKWYSLYQSHTKSESSDGHVDESSLDKRALVWKRAGVMLGIPLGLLALVLGGFSGISALGHGLQPEKPKVVQRPNPSVMTGLSPAAAAPAVAPAPVSPLAPGYSRDWRISAVLENKRKRIIVASGRAGLRRLDPEACTYALPDQLECVVDGQLVTTFSGPDSSTYLAVAPKTLD